MDKAILGGRLAIAACLALAAAFSTAALNQKTVPHLEKCTVWDFQGDHLGTTNTCAESVTIQFMLLNNQRIERRDLKPGEVFESGISRKDDEAISWIYTTCPVGYSPNVPFTLEGEAAVSMSLYDCVMK